jgi:gamma-glutamyltranspeptidase/glutathione hydrolase
VSPATRREPKKSRSVCVSATMFANVIDFGMDIQTAITIPRMRTGGSTEAGTEIRPIFLVEDRIPTATMDALRAKGYEIRPIAQSGHVNAIIIDPVTGFRLGGADPRENGYALGW